MTFKPIDRDRAGRVRMTLIIAELEKLDSDIQNYLWKISGKTVERTLNVETFEFTPFGIEVMLYEVGKHFKLLKNYCAVAEEAKVAWEELFPEMLTTTELKARAAEFKNDFELAQKIRNEFQEEKAKLFLRWEKNTEAIEAVLGAGVVIFGIVKEHNRNTCMDVLPFFLDNLSATISDTIVAARCVYHRYLNAIPIQFRSHPPKIGPEMKEFYKF